MLTSKGIAASTMVATITIAFLILNQM